MLPVVLHPLLLQQIYNNNRLPRRRLHTNYTALLGAIQIRSISAGSYEEFSYWDGGFFLHLTISRNAAPLTTVCNTCGMNRVPHHSDAPFSSPSCSGRLPGQGSIVTATPMPLRPTGMSVTLVHSFLSGQ